MHRSVYKTGKDAAKIQPLMLVIVGLGIAIVVLFVALFMMQENPQTREYVFADRDESGQERAAGGRTREIVSSIDGFSAMDEEEIFDEGLYENASLQGMVIDQSETPVSEALVRAVRITNLDAPLKAKEFQFFETESRESGRFAFKDLPPGTYSLCASSDDLAGHGNCQVESQADDIDESICSVTLVLQPAEKIAGTVKSIKGAPVENALVVPLSMKAAIARTDEDGRFALRGLLKGRYTVSVQADSFISQAKSAVKSGREDLTFTLSPHRSLAEVKASSQQYPSEAATIDNADAVIEGDRSSDIPQGRRVMRRIDHPPGTIDPRHEGRHVPPGMDPILRGKKPKRKPPPPPENPPPPTEEPPKDEK